MDFLFVLIELFSLDVMAEALRANINRKSAFLKGIGQFRPISRSRGRPTRTIFALINRPVMPDNFVADSIYTKKLSSRSVKVYTKNGRFAFFRPRWGLGATYDVHLRLIGKRVVDFLSLIELFFAKCYRWGATGECRLDIGVFSPTGSVWPNTLGTRGRQHQAFFMSEN